MAEKETSVPNIAGWKLPCEWNAKRELAMDNELRRQAAEGGWILASDAIEEIDFWSLYEAALNASPASPCPENGHNGWRDDMENAPKDGTVILVEGGTVDWRRLPYPQGVMESGWFSHKAQRFLQWEPKYWQPVPAPPTKGGA